MQDSPVFFDSVKTALGKFQVGATQLGLVSICFPNRHSVKPKQGKVPRRARTILRAAQFFLQDFFRGKSSNPARIPVDWRFFSPFDQRVLKVLRNVPATRTVTYSGLARRAQVPHAARAVGNSLSRNPIPILIPCHRVIRKNGSLGGYRGGRRLKRTLVSLERRAN